MKRFFKPLAGAASKKVKPEEEGGTVGTAGTHEGVSAGEQRLDPLTFITWNANSLLGRIKNGENKAAFLKYVKEHDPDVIALQETWLPAATNPIR